MGEGGREGGREVWTGVRTVSLLWCIFVAVAARREREREDSNEMKDRGLATYLMHSPFFLSRFASMRAAISSASS